MTKSENLNYAGFEKLKKTLDLRKRYFDVEGTVISGAAYYNSTGVIMRSSGKKKIMGYCCETPKQVLEKLMPDFYVTSYCGMEFYGVGDCDSPLRGISIDQENFPGVYGKKVAIDGKLGEILELDEEIFHRLKRKEPLSDKERLMIVGNISGYSQNAAICVKRYSELMDFLTSVKR